MDDHTHYWIERRVTAILRTCTEDGATELVPNRAGRLLGQFPRLRSQRTFWPIPAARGPHSGNAERWAAWREAYESDPRSSVTSLAAQFGVTYGKMVYGLRRAGTTLHQGRPQRPEGDTRAADMLAMAREHKTFTEIGLKHGVTRERVRQILQKAGATKDDLHQLVAARPTKKDATERPCPICGEMIALDHGASYRAHRKAKHPWITPENAAKYVAMAADYEAGMKERDIKTKYHCTAGLIYRALRYVGKTHNRRNSGRSRSLVESRARMDRIAEDLAMTTLKAGDIAEKHGVSASLVNRINVRRHIRSPRVITPEIADQMRELRRIEKLPYIEIGRRLGFSEDAVGAHIGRRSTRKSA